jgi:hypothetical protein
MSRRSVGNDRYRVERSGKTRKSASAAKPKREAGAAASDSAKKKPKKAGKKSLTQTLFGKGEARTPVPRVEPTPEMKIMRRWWWGLMGAAIIIAVAMVPVSKMNNKTVDSVLFGVYAAALGGALYLEFGPLRKARLAAIDAAKTGGKSKKAAAKDAGGPPADAKAAGKAKPKKSSGDVEAVPTPPVSGADEVED